MPTAKTYITWKIIDGPYDKGGKDYLKVQNPNTSAIKEVRYWSYKEYEKKYGEPCPVKDPFYKTKKEVLGFGEKNYIVLIDAKDEDEWCIKNPEIRYAKHWKWYAVDYESIPKDCPHTTKEFSWKNAEEMMGE